MLRSDAAFQIHDLTDTRDGHAIFGGETCHRDAACGEPFANFSDLCIGQLGERVSLTAWRIYAEVGRGRGLSTLGPHVSHVIECRSKKQMAKPGERNPVNYIDADFIITNTVAHVAGMQDEHTSRDGSAHFFPSKAMSRDGLPVTFGLAIPTASGSACPKPTAIGAVGLDNLSPQRTAEDVVASCGAKTTGGKGEGVGRDRELVVALITDAHNMTVGDRIGEHRLVLSTGAEPRSVTADAGTFRPPHYTKKPHIYARFGDVPGTATVTGYES